MKKTPITKIPTPLPDDIVRFIGDARIYDSSCSPEAKVYFIDRAGGYYLKISGAGTLFTEAEMTSYFHSKGMGAEVLCYLSGERDILLSSRVAGEDCTHPTYIKDPRRLCDTLAVLLRELHETDFSGCPVGDRMGAYIKTVETNHRCGNFDTSFFSESFGNRSAEEAYAVFKSGAHSLKSEVLLHGDYCLPNIILDGWRLSGFIDVGCGGVGDRHVDIFWGAWTLWFNLGTNAYRERFLDAYGRDKIDEELLKVVAAAEVFG